jgi:DNA replicative helicase MCM subunit Mcm2 (Cdc46/Mcm family)
VAGKVTILIAEDTVDEAFYWSSISRTKKMKRIIGQLNRKLPQLLKEGEKPTTTLLSFQPKLETQTTFTAKQQTSMPTPTQEPNRKILWRPETIQIKGLTQALKWLMENLPNQTVTINEIIKKAMEDEGLEKAAVETAIWRLTQQGQIYQPEPGKIRKIWPYQSF